MTGLPQHVRDLIDRAVRDHGVETLDVSTHRAGRTQVLSVVLDHDSPLEADLVEEVSRRLSAVLDEVDPLDGAYTLEVTTPGLDRPLVRARDFRRQRGHEVRISKTEAAGGGVLQGIVSEVVDDEVALEIDGAHVTVPMAEIAKGKVVLPW